MIESTGELIGCTPRGRLHLMRDVLEFLRAWSIATGGLRKEHVEVLALVAIIAEVETGETPRDRVIEIAESMGETLRALSEEKRIAYILDLLKLHE